MLQLYFTLASPPCRAVLQTIRVLGLEVKVKNVENGEHLTPEYLKLNPMHQVPVLLDGDFVISESRAIMTYLVNSKKPGNSFYPSEAKARALIDQRLYFEAINFFELAASILRPMVQSPETPAPADKIFKLKDILKLLESFLEKSLYFAGDQPTLVDISILSTYILFKSTFINYGNLPNVEAWFQRCQSLPGFKENCAGSKAIEALMTTKGISPISLQ